MRVGCYVRVSTSIQAEKGYSIEEQTERLNKYCEAMGWNVYKAYTDGGFSGANIERPALNQLIQDVKLRKIEKVVVYKLDRLSRSQKDTLYLIEEVFLANNCDFVSMSENFDTATPFGKAMVGILSVFAQLEREQIKERMVMGQLARAKKGKYAGSDKLPVGYDYINGELVVNEFEKIQVQKIFDMFVRGLSAYAIAQMMNDMGYRTKYGKWRRETVKRLLSKKTYIGYVRYSNKWYKGNHEAIIDEELFEAVQLMLAKSDKTHTGAPASYLGGLVICGCCGEKYRKAYSLHPKGYKYNYYKCSTRIRKNGKTCNNLTYRMEELDELIFNEFRKIELEDIEADAQEDNTEVIQEEVKKIDAKIKKLLDLYSVEDVPMELLNEQIHELNEQRERLNAYEPPTAPIEHIASIEDVIEGGDIDEIRALVKILTDKIVIRGEDIEIYWAF